MWPVFPLLLVLNKVNSQSITPPQSPCPDVFRYEPPGKEPNRWYGVVTLATDVTLYGLWLNIGLDNKADIIGNWEGEVTTTDNIDFKITNDEKKIVPGSGYSVRFFVKYNKLKEVPKLQVIRLNGKEICNADSPLPASNRPSDEGKGPDAQDAPEFTVSVPQNGLRPNEIITRPVHGRPAEVGPVYVPTENPPLQESNVRPFNIGPTNQNNYWNDGLPSADVTGGDQTYNQGNNFNQQAQKIIQCGKMAHDSSVNPLVVGGKETLEGQWPWHIALYHTQSVDSSYLCGGTLVTRKHIVTAAHCVTHKWSTRTMNPNTLTVYLGKHNLRTTVEGVQIKFVRKITVHPQYNPKKFLTDASILQLREDVQYTDWVRPICLWPENLTDLSYVVGKRGYVVGWGYNNERMLNEELALVEMPVVDHLTCARSNEFFLSYTSSGYCAGDRNGSSACNGDSGGGMVFKMQTSWYIRGLVSLSLKLPNENRCDPNQYIIFTDLAKMLSWIKQTIGGN